MLFFIFLEVGKYLRYFFFFQAEDGIRDKLVTGVQTCALPISAWNAFKDGFIVHSNDDKHQLRITGQIQADARVYPRHSDFTDNDTFLVRRARLGIEATVFDYYEFRFLPDWGNNKSVVQD